MWHHFPIVGLAASFALGATPLASADESAAQRFAIQGTDVVTDGWVGLNGASFDTGVLKVNGTAWVNYTRCLIRFDLKGIDVGRFGRVEKATLRLTATAVVNKEKRPATIAASTIGWTNQANWGTTDGKQAWPSRRGHQNIDYAMSDQMQASRVIESAGVIEFDVTNMVDGWLYQGLSNHGFVVRNGGTVFGKPGAGTWTLEFAASESEDGNGPALIVEMSGRPPSPATIAERTLRWYPSALLPPVSNPYIFYWDFGPAPRFPGGVTNAAGSGSVPPVTAAQRGIMPLSWFYGPQNPWLKTEAAFVDSYVNAARGPTLGIMVDEWQNPRESKNADSPLSIETPFGISGSVKGIIEAKKTAPSLFIAVAWRGEPSIEPMMQHGLPDLLMIEGYTHVSKKLPRASFEVDMAGIKRRVDYSRKLGAIERTICWLGHIRKPEEYHPEHLLTTDIIDSQIAELRRWAPEMPGIAFYGNSDPQLAEQCDRLARRHFVEPAPDLRIVEPSFQESIATPHATIRVATEAKDNRRVVGYRWFIDNRLVARTEQPHYVWDLRGERSGMHFITVHAVDSGFNRSAAQIVVLVNRDE